MSLVVWIDGVSPSAEEGWVLRTLHRTRHGYDHACVPLASADRLPVMSTAAPVFGPLPTAMHYVTIPSLRAAETLLAPAELLRRLLPDLPAGNGHAILKIEGEPTIYIPALLLIQALWMGRHALNRALVTPNGIDQLAVVRTGGDGTQLLIRRGLAPSHLTGRLVRLLAWALTRPDARASHASVLEHLRRGQLGLRMPETALRCWVRGFELDGLGVLAFALGAVDLHLPIRGPRIEARLGDTRLVFPAYQAPPHSPWSTHYDNPDRRA